MRRQPLDVSGMIRALEDYLAATRPASPPEPPRPKTQTESTLEKMLEELSKPLPPEPETLSTESSRDETVDNSPDENELAPILLDEQPLQEQPAKDNVALTEDIVLHGPVRLEDDVPAPPQAAPNLPSEPASAELPRENAVDSSPNPRRSRTWALAAAILIGASPMLLKRRPTRASRKPVRPVVATPVKRQPVAPESPLPSDPQARALALVLAYRPSGGPVTSGEIFRSIAGDPIPAENWEIRAGEADRFAIRFVPYRGALGENYSYDFEVDARAGRVRPRPDTVERLRVDALGRLASRSDLQAFWQFLDLGR